MTALDSLANYRCIHRLRVRWAEVDMQKIVFNGHYLMYFDTAMADYWRALAMPYEDAMHLLDGDLYVKKASLEYHASARYDDTLQVGLHCARVGNSSILFKGGIFCGDQLLVSGELVYVFANPQTQKSSPVPLPLRNLLLNFEAGAASSHVVVGHWDALQADAGRIRNEVFVQEQSVPVDMEWDADDARSLHAVAYNPLGQAVATGRLLPPEKASSPATQTGRIGRMATSRVLRGGGLGEQVLQALVAQARMRGDTHILLHAQRSAEAFYAKAGFIPHGAPFTEVGIAHIEMLRVL